MSTLVNLNEYPYAEAPTTRGRQAGMSEIRSLDQHVGFMLAVARARVLRAVNACLADHGLHARSYSALALACQREGVSQRELSEELQLDPSQIVAVVDGLEAAGWVERQVSKADRRIRAVVATPQGREKHRTAAQEVATVEDELLAVLQEDERQALLYLLTRIVHGDRAHQLNK